MHKGVSAVGFLRQGSILSELRAPLFSPKNKKERGLVIDEMNAPKSVGEGRGTSSGTSRNIDDII